MELGDNKTMKIQIIRRKITHKEVVDTRNKKTWKVENNDTILGEMDLFDNEAATLVDLFKDGNLTLIKGGVEFRRNIYEEEERGSFNDDIDKQIIVKIINK